MSDDRTTEQTATERLRSLLDERGVEYARNGCEVFFVVDNKPMHIWAIDDEELCVSIAGLTPEQAIAATLGSDMLTAEQVKRIHAVIEKHWHDLPADYDMPEATALPEYSYDWQAIADDLNATLGGDGKSRWAELFGTPERAARTLYYDKEPICAGCALMDECKKIPDEEHDTCLLVDYESLLEWLRDDAE